MTELPPAFAPGSIVADKYRVERCVGRGGMGLVLEAIHLQLEQTVALKVLLPEVAALQGAASRFLREARAAARLQSEHVARVLDVGALVDGTPFIVMEHLTGTDLHRVSRARGPLPVQEVVGWVLQVCSALAEAHALGIVHRDLKPSNIFLANRRDGSQLVKLLDFGIAKAPAAWAEGDLTQSGVLGSPSYMSPEQLRDTSTVDHRTDIWSLGIILHELLTLRYPFEATSPIALGALVATAEPSLLRAHRADLPAELEAVVQRCLQKEPSARFATVAALAEALAPLASERAAISVARIASMSDAANATIAFTPPASSPMSSPASSPASLRSLEDVPPSSRARSGVRTPTDNFRRQHEELALMGGDILQQLDVDDAAIVARASDLRRQVARFAGKLRVHASMENDALYPRLLEHREQRVRETAQSLLREVKDLYSAFDSYSQRWPSTASIEAQPRLFAKDTRKVLKTLWMRMCRENDELYPLADAAG